MTCVPLGNQKWVIYICGQHSWASGWHLARISASRTETVSGSWPGGGLRAGCYNSRSESVALFQLRVAEFRNPSSISWASLWHTFMTDFSSRLGVTLYWSILQSFYVQCMCCWATISHDSYWTICNCTYPVRRTTNDCSYFRVFFTDNFPPDLSGALHTIFEEQLPEPETNLNSVVLVSYTIHPIPAEKSFSIRNEFYLKDSVGRNSLDIDVNAAAARGRQLSTQTRNTISTEYHSKEKCSGANVRWRNRNF